MSVGQPGAGLIYYMRSLAFVVRLETIDLLFPTADCNILTYVSFQDLQLDSKLLQAVDKAGFTKPTKIQSEAIPVVLTGEDVMASAQTGTGKTAAFVLPILHRLQQRSAKKGGKGPRVLVLTPTRELAAQINDDIAKFGRFCEFRAGSIVGGVGYGPQIKLLSRPFDLLVATPGRLMDHMNEGLVDFSRMEVLVLDEADRMLDMGFIKPVRKIVAATPAKRQTLFFSATLEGEVLNMAKEFMQPDAKRIRLAVNARRHDSIAQHVYLADNPAHKMRLLVHHLDDETLNKAVIFTRTKRLADRLSKRLNSAGYKSGALHGDMRQGQRTKTVDQMKAGKVRILVATDVAARGLDIKGVSHVVNYDLPMVAEDYIHRIGRTARAGASGTAVSFVIPEEWERLTNIQKLTGWELARETIMGLEPTCKEPRKGAKPPSKKKQASGQQKKKRTKKRSGCDGVAPKKNNNRNNTQSSTSAEASNAPTKKQRRRPRRRSNRPRTCESSQ